MDRGESRSRLDAEFFTDDDYVRKGTREYEDFWRFASRWKSFKRRRRATADASECRMVGVLKSAGESLDLPRTYDPALRLNVLLEGRGRRADPELAESLSVLHHYLDFSQRQRLGKLSKLLRDQRNLPIWPYRDAIVRAVQGHPLVLIAGDTGCGKSTQVPRYLLTAGHENIACTQPRRIACVSLCKRVAYETLGRGGSRVGFQIRFDSSRTSATKILFLTEGLLLRQAQRDACLSRYNVVVVDEVHERHLHCDFLLGLLRRVLSQRHDLKVVLMSATINVGLFSRYFDAAPVIRVPGRLFPIKVIYRPIPPEEQAGKTERLDPRPYLRILQTIDEKYCAEERGDLLMFLSGMAEISAIADAVRSYAADTKRWIVLALHSSLSAEEQDKVFDNPPEGVRKCIISTNIAETSVTIDGVRFIVDSGKVKEMNFDKTSKMQRLQEFWISQASAEQRKGRAGRTGPGICWRLYAESDYDAFTAYAVPEILRLPLDSLVLQMKSMSMGDPRVFPFIEPPESTSLESSMTFLKEQGALDEHEELTAMGRVLAMLPLDVIAGKVLITGSLFSVLEPVLTVAAALSVQSPFVRSAFTNPEFSRARHSLESNHGDPFTLLNAFNEWVHVKAEGRASSRKWSRRHGLEEQRLYEIANLRRQYKELLQQYGLCDNDDNYKPRRFEPKQIQERRRLRQLRSEQCGLRKAKVLRLEDGMDTFDGDDETPDGQNTNMLHELQDLKFKLRHDLNQLQASSQCSRALTLQQVNLLKMVLSSGLYPQVAIPDENNTTRGITDQLFHTRRKQFVVLHPNSVFANDPKILLAHDDHKSEGPDSSKPGFGVDPQLLVYVSFLETTKPYLVNVFRAPAIQVLLQFSSSLDTNTDCRKVVVDSWLEISFEDSEEAQKLLWAAVRLRSAWSELLKAHLQGRASSQGCGKLASTLSCKLAEFLAVQVKYKLRRLSCLEAQNLYVGPGVNGGKFSTEGLIPIGQSKPHPNKGGTAVNDFLTYNCLVEDKTLFGECLRVFWTCPICSLHFPLTPLEKLQHMEACTLAAPAEHEEGQEEKKSSSSSHLQQLYHCASCEQDLLLTPMEIIKHRRTHK
uniref:DEAH (Asp-Glu-Ala-His) box polypeptide 34 n=1 Tax=Eptatretus burgeri TaxID=7764 RepID=A0A8C4R2H8_EPTBU